jgi:hypothetical protein
VRNACQTYIDFVPTTLAAVTPTDIGTATDRMSTTRMHSPRSSTESLSTASNSLPSSGTPFVVYIVTDIRYPTTLDFDLNKGSFHIDSVHSSRKNANARAKKIIYDSGQVDGGQFKVDVDKIIEETRKGLFAAIGIGGKGDGREKGCYARKCQVEAKMIDEDSDIEGDGEDERMGEDEKCGEGMELVNGDRDGDLQMG